MNNQWLVGSLLICGLGTAAACGGDGGTGAQPASFGNAAGNGDVAVAGEPGSGGALSPGGASSGGGTRSGGGTTSSGGMPSGGGTRNAAGEVGSGGMDLGGVGGAPGAGGSSSTRPSTFPLLVAATNDKVLVWQNADAAKDGAAPAFELPVALGDKGVLTGVVATGERLGVASSVGLFLYDDLGTLSAASKPTAVIPPKAFSASLGGNFKHQFVDSDGDLWLTYGQGRVALLKDFEALTAASKPAAEFTHEWEQLASAAYYAPGDMLFAAQVSGAGLLYYSKAKTKTGVTNPNGAFDKFNGWESAVLGSSLFAVGADGLGAWHGLDAAGTPRAPDATRGDAQLYLDASANAVAVVGDAGTVSYYGSASALSSGSKPETLHVAPALHGVDLARDAQTLVTVGDSKVYVVAHAPSGLTLRAALPLGDGQGSDVVLVE